MDWTVLRRLRRWLFDRFSGRLVLVILVLSLGPLAASTYISSAQTQDALDEQAVEIQREAATRIAENAKARSEFFKRQADLIEENPYVRSIVAHRYQNQTLASAAAEYEQGAGYPQTLAGNRTYRQTQRYFSSVAAENPSMEMIRVFWRDGNILTGNKFGQEDLNDYVGDRYWFQQTMSPDQTPEDSVYVSALNIETTTEGQGQPMIRYAVPVEIDGERVAAVVVNYASEQITEPVANLQVGENGYGALLDTDHVDADGNRQGPVYIENGRDPFLTFVPDIDTIPVPEDQNSGQLAYEEEGESWVAYFKRITLASDRAYHVVVTQPERELTAPSRQIVRNALVLVGLGVPIVLLVGGLASRRIARPIEQFANDAKRVAQGDLEHEITQAAESSVYELRQMTSAARQMKDELVSALEYQEIFDSIRDPIFVYSLEDDQVLTVNSATVESLGYEESTFEGADLGLFTPAGAAGTLDSLRSRIEVEDPLRFEETFQTSDGTTFQVEANATKISYYGTEAVLSVCRDISTQKARQRELERQNERLDRFASVVSHDLRNPLATATTALELARQTGDSEQFDTVEQAHDRMQNMIEELLTLARAETTVDETETISLTEHAQTAWSTAETPDSDLTVELPWSFQIEADPELLRHILENLFRNATDHNEPPVSVTLGELDGSEHSTGFYVEDDGTGIPPEQREDIFEHGFTTQERGTGFGLSIVAEFVEAHGWEIAVTESDDGGARFEIRTG